LLGNLLLGGDFLSLGDSFGKGLSDSLFNLLGGLYSSLDFFALGSFVVDLLFLSIFTNFFDLGLDLLDVG
jgi:hypothetical protein